MLSLVLDLVLMADNMPIADNMRVDMVVVAITAINHVPPQIDQQVIAIAYIAIISLAITTSGIVNMFPSIHIRDAAAMFHSIIKSNAAAMFHSIIVRHAAAKFHNITTLANVSIAQSILVKNAAAMFQAITTSILANHNVHHNALHNVVRVVTEAKQFLNCVSYCQTGRRSLPV